MNLKILNCIIFIMIVVVLIAYLNIQEPFKNSKKIVENFYQNNIPKNDNTNTTQINNNISNIVNNDLRDTDIVNDIQNAIRDQTTKGEEAVITNQDNMDRRSRNEIEPLTPPEELIKDSESLNNMFKKLIDAENLCDNLAQRQEKIDAREQNKIYKKSLEQIDEQQGRISELNEVLTRLRKEQLKNEIVNKKCQANNQKLINSDYNIVKKLASNNLLRNQSLKVDLNVSDELKKLKLNLGRNNNNSTNNLNPTIATLQERLSQATTSEERQIILDQLRTEIQKLYGAGSTNVNFVSPEEIAAKYDECKVDKSKYIDINELQTGKCQGCDSEVLQQDSQKINRDFKN